MANRVAIFIDGAYLDYLLRDFGNPRLDFGALAQRLAGDSDILRTYYYHCPAYQSKPPTDEESRRYAGQRQFFEQLDRLPRFEVRLGRLAFRGHDQQGRPRFEQKRVDILLGVDMVLHAVKQAIQEVVLVAGDSDFIPAIEVAKNEGALIRLFHGESPHTDLWRLADERTRIDQAFVDSVARREAP